MLFSLLLLSAIGVTVDPAPGAETRLTVDSVRQFPRVEGSNLEGRRFLLPADFEAELNVVIVAFRREQQAEVDTWLPFLAEQKVRERGVRVYELPTLNRSYTIMRRFIDGGMARGIPEKATRDATITLYIDKSPFKKALAISTEDRIVTMIVARDGRVLWRVDGRFTKASGAELAGALENAIKAIASASSPAG
jgi:hypothetical protein